LVEDEVSSFKISQIVTPPYRCARGSYGIKIKY